MFHIAMGALSAGSLGIADFIASQTSERIGAARALAGMLAVSSGLLTVLMLVQGGFDGFFVPAHAVPILLGCLHGAAMSVALCLFFHAMSVGKISVVAPIIAAHPVVIVAYFATNGAYLLASEILSIGCVLLGVALVAASGSGHESGPTATKRYASWRKVVCVSLLASIVYGVAIIFLQKAASGIDDLKVLWLGRCVGLITVSTLVFAKRQTLFPRSARWMGIFLLHGCLDSAGLMFILFGTSGGAADAITAVVASAFPVVTVLLAWLLLKERLGAAQVAGAALVFTGVAVLAAH